MGDVEARKICFSVATVTFGLSLNRRSPESSEEVKKNFVLMNWIAEMASEWDEHSNLFSSSFSVTLKSVRTPDAWPTAAITVEGSNATDVHPDSTCPE
jgi:hypothetical protein